MSELTDQLEALAERGVHRGADEVVAAALAEAREIALVPSPRRRPWRVVGALTTAAVVLAAALVGGGLLYTRVKLDDIDRLDLRGQLAGSATPAEPMTVLVVGSDSRAGLDAADERRLGSTAEVGAARADTIMVVRLDPSRDRATVLSLPRDLWVPIDGGAEQRINTALTRGPEVLVRTVQDVLGIRLDHYVQVDFTGFRRVVDAVGGVSVSFGAPTRDTYTGLDVPAGCLRLDGEQALAFVRSRQLQQLVDGRWIADPTGDLGRIERQQRFLLDGLRTAATDRNPLTMGRLLDAVADHVQVDDRLSSGELVTIGRRLASMDAADVTFVPVAVTNARVGAAAVLRADPPALLDAGRSLLGTSATPSAGGETPTTAPAGQARCQSFQTGS